jgi:hypothetical protein
MDKIAEALTEKDSNTFKQLFVDFNHILNLFTEII